MQHFSRKLFPIANVLVFKCLLFLFVLQQHTHTHTHTNRRKVKNTDLKKWTGQNYWHLVKIIRNTCFSSTWCSCNLYFHTPVASNRCGQYSNQICCNQLKCVYNLCVVCHTVDGEKKEAVMGETKLFEALNQVNQMLWKMIRCFEALETAHAGDTCWWKPCKSIKSSEQTYTTNGNVFFFRNTIFF